MTNSYRCFRTEHERLLKRSDKQRNPQQIVQITGDVLLSRELPDLMPQSSMRNLFYESASVEVWLVQGKFVGGIKSMFP